MHRGEFSGVNSQRVSVDLAGTERNFSGCTVGHEVDCAKARAACESVHYLGETVAVVIQNHDLTTRRCRGGDLFKPCDIIGDKYHLVRRRRVPFGLLSA